MFTLWKHEIIVVFVAAVKKFMKNGRNKCIGEEKPLLEACFGASINGTLQTVVGTTNFQVEE